MIPLALTILSKPFPRLLFILIAVVGLLSFVYWHAPESPTSAAPWNAAKTYKRPALKGKIAVASMFGYHFDVYLSLVWTLERLVKQGTSIQVYTPEPYHFNFEEIVDGFGLYDGSIKDVKTLVHDLSHGEGDDAIRLLILGTCEVEYVSLQPTRVPLARIDLQ